MAFDLRGAFPSKRSERAQNPSLMDTSRVDGVKAPQHRETLIYALIQAINCLALVNNSSKTSSVNDAT